MLPNLLRHPWMDEDIEAFREQVRRYIEGELAPQLDGWRRQGYIPQKVWAQFAEMGYLLPEMPEVFGGAGANLAYQLVVQDELTKAEIPAITAVHSIATHYILDYGTPEQKQRWLPKLVSGEMIAGIAMSEPGCGSDLQAISTKARLEGDHYVINGAKTFITNGYVAGLIVLASRTGDKGSRGISLIVLETENLPGYSVSKRLEKLGQHASDTAELAFDNVRVPAHHLLGGEAGHGFKQLMSQLPYERMLIAVPAVAAIERAVALTVEYTQQRKAFGQALYELQNTRFKLAECATTAHIARSFVNDCIQRLLNGELDDSAAYMAKWWCTEQQCKVIDECLQLFGGYGYVTEYPIARMYADARVQRIYGGANEIMKELVARKLGQA
ncbi:acyl-CoA dehydrogenase family protein [Comamonas sp. J-3]|uniref:acyl-CoA dehydrogenase family protein n=1 Tax=Comamonas trifloxystrobinivorans TaxID=3350256 RepID=UPI00372CE318